MTFVETKLFTKLALDYLSDDEYAAMQQFLVVNPEAGDVIPGSGGVRKLPWGVAGRGKRGGNVADNVPAKVLRKIKEEIDAEE